MSYSTHAYHDNRHVYDNPRIVNHGYHQQLALQEAEKILETDPAIFIGEALNEYESIGEEFIGGVLKLLDKLPQAAIPDSLLGVYDDLLATYSGLIDQAKVSYAKKRYPELF